MTIENGLARIKFIAASRQYQEALRMQQKYPGDQCVARFVSHAKEDRDNARAAYSSPTGDESETPHG